MSYKEHKEQAPKSLMFAVVTLSDTRDKTSDKSGNIIVQSLIEAGHKVSFYEVIREDKETIEQNFAQLISNSEIDVIITNGGTGITSRDNTIEVARKFFIKELDGLGEIFRLISYQQIGTAAILSRATAGLVDGKKILICLPGSSKAVKLAMNRIIIPEICHMIREARR